MTNNAVDRGLPKRRQIPRCTNIQSQIASAYAGGAWSGSGITSSNANASSFAVGYGERSALTTLPAIFAGADADSVLIRYTRYGDADLNGVVNLLDFNKLAANFNTSGKVWTDGDFNYDGNVNLLDFNKLAGNFNQSATGVNGQPTPQDWANLAAAVPEPTSGMLILGGLAFCRRRRRSNT